MGSKSNILVCGTRRRALSFFSWFALILATPVAWSQDVRNAALFRHHVIFLLDSSGSMFSAGATPGEYRMLIQSGVPALLKDGQRNGFGVDIYDPQRDLSTAFAFGLTKQNPYFDPTIKDGFIRTLWFQAPAKTYDDLLNSTPPFDRYWTAIQSGFIQAVRKAHSEVREWGVENRAFDRTFLVMISDGRANTSTNSIDEIREIRGAALEFNHRMNDMMPDHRAAAEYAARLSEMFVLASADSSEGALGHTIGHYKVILRELQPIPHVNVGSLLSSAPERNTQLERRAYGHYVGTLRLAAGRPRNDEKESYDLVGLRYRGPGDKNYQTVSLPTAENPFISPIDLKDSGLDGARADYELSFVRRDQVYGQAVQVFTEQIRFRREPRKNILGILPILDVVMALHPGLNQDEIVAIDSVLLFLGVCWLIQFLFFPPARAEMELVGDAGSRQSPVVVDFSRVTEQKGQQIILRTVRFHNTARRRLPWTRTLMPRWAERHFDVDLDIKTDLPPEAGPDPVVGIGPAIQGRVSLVKQTAGSEATIGVTPAVMADFNGNSAEPVEYTLTVLGRQRGKRLKLFPFERNLERQVHRFWMRFAPEEPNIQVRLLARVDSDPTGDAAKRAIPPGGIILSHCRGREATGAPAEFEFQIANAAGHFCSKSAAAHVTAVVQHANGQGAAYDSVVSETDVDGIAKGKQRSVEIRLPYEELPLPPNSGDDYILSVTASPAAGQQWLPITARLPVRIGPDKRKTSLSLKIAAPTERSRDLAWNAFEGISDGSRVSVRIAVPILWNIGQIKESTVFSALSIDNVARSGAGQLTLRLKHGAVVRPHPEVDPHGALEPKYLEGGADRIVHLLDRDESIPLSDTRDWVIPNEAIQRPLHLKVQFQPYGIDTMERRPPRYRYVCELPFECVLQEAPGDAGQSFSFTVEVDFEVQRYTGDHALAVDFGTSAVVVAFESNETNIVSRSNDFSAATQNLQERFKGLVDEWSASKDQDLKSYSLDDEENPEKGTAFLSSVLLLGYDKKAGNADFVILPSPFGRTSAEWHRAVYYLKALILSGSRFLPTLPGTGGLDFTWRDKDDEKRKAINQIEVDDVMRSAYLNLYNNYIEPILRQEKKLQYLERLVVSHPNNFTVSHISRVRGILQGSFPEFTRIDLLSESNAVALYCSRNPGRFFRVIPEAGEHRHLLIYDIGAGTVDLSYLRLEWAPEVEGGRLKELQVLFRSGAPVAGNRLDACLASILDSKIRSLAKSLREKQIDLRYQNPIADPPPVEDLHYPPRMVKLKRELHSLKVDATSAAKNGNDFTLHVRVDAGASLSEGILTATSTDGQAFSEAGMTSGSSRLPGSGRQVDWIGIPLGRKEIFDHPEVKSWLETVAGELISNLAGALQTLRLTPEIDTLVLSGRTAQFPPLRPYLLKALKQHLGVDTDALFIPELTPNEKKEAVALGSLLYGIFHGRDLHITDRNIWARYGVIYTHGTTKRFQEFFGYSTEPGPGDDVVEENGLRMAFFRRAHEITRSGGPLEVAATFSRDPDADLLDPQKVQERFSILHTIGVAQLGKPGKVWVEMRNNRDDTISVLVDPKGFALGVDVRGRREESHVAQLEWPYQPLSRKRTARRASAQGS